MRDGECERVCDVVRAMLVADDVATVCEILDAVAALSAAGVVRVVRVKDRFANPSAGGWRDVMINLVVCGGTAPSVRHVCEVR